MKILSGRKQYGPDEMATLQSDRDRFVGFRRPEIPLRPIDFAVVTATNLGIRETSDGQVFELEPGPNRCAVSHDASTID